MFVLEDDNLKRSRLLLTGYLPAQSPTKRERSADSFFANLENNPVIQKFIKHCRYAGLELSDIRKLLKRMAVFSVVILSLAVFAKTLLVLVLLTLYLSTEFLRLGIAVKSRVRAFDKDYTALLLSLASGTKSGLDPIIALCESSALFSSDSIISEQIKEFAERISRGEGEREALSKFAQHINHPDVELFRVAMILARREGSSLGECLRRLAKVTRQRQSFRRKVDIAIAMQKLSAWGIAACAVIITLIQFQANPESIYAMLSDPIGSKLIVLGLCLVLSGIIWMRSLGRSRFHV